MTPEEAQRRRLLPAIVMWMFERQCYDVLAFHIPKDWTVPPVAPEELTRLTAGLPTVQFTLQCDWDE
jgi:hypothetical protein